MSYRNRPLSWEDPANDPDACDTCGEELEHDVDGDRDEDGNVYAVVHTYCPNDRCPESENYEPSEAELERFEEMKLRSMYMAGRTDESQ